MPWVVMPWTFSLTLAAESERSLMKHNHGPSSCSRCLWPSSEAMLPESSGPSGEFIISFMIDN